MERRLARHLDRLVLVVGQDEDRCVVGRLVPPPAAPLLLPRATYGPVHVAAHHIGAARSQEQVAGARVVLVQRLVEMPMVELHAADPERALEALVGPRDESERAFFDQDSKDSPAFREAFKRRR